MRPSKNRRCRIVCSPRRELGDQRRQRARGARRRPAAGRRRRAAGASVSPSSSSPGAGGVERREAVGLARFHRLEHLFLGDPAPRRPSRRSSASGPAPGDSASTTLPRRRYSSCMRRGARTAQPLSRKWRLSSPTMVWRGVGRELEAALGVEAVDRLEQADRRHLHEVVERLAPVGEAPGQVLGQAEVGLDQLVAEAGVACCRRTRRTSAVARRAPRRCRTARSARSVALDAAGSGARPPSAVSSCSSTRASRICSERSVSDGAVARRRRTGPRPRPRGRRGSIE